MAFPAFLKRFRHDSSKLDCRFIRRGGWLGSNLDENIRPPAMPMHRRVEDRARTTNRAGNRPLWSGYGNVANYPQSTRGSRTSDQVRTDKSMGRFFSWLARQRHSDVVVEFGTAFGVSGMYWLAGLENGHLYTFEPNRDWATFAEENLRAISTNFTLSMSTFEDEGPKTLESSSVDIALIDAIYTSEFVDRQYAVLKPLMKPGGLILFDDIDFSADMADCWRRISEEPSLVASAKIGARVGIVEMPL
jgi:predicted O-methyltransferase YrrM